MTSVSFMGVPSLYIYLSLKDLLEKKPYTLLWKYDKDDVCVVVKMFRLSCAKEYLYILSIFYILQVLVLGQPGEEVSLELILRVVADVGLVVSVYIYFVFMYACTVHFAIA